MSAGPYRAVLFDLFDTLVRFDRTRLPAVEVDGRTVHTTAGALHAVLRPYAPHVTVAALYEALVASWQEAERRRARDHREVPARERFAYLAGCLALDPARWPAGLLDALIAAHRDGIAQAAELPAAHRALLEELAGRYRLAVVSNFDYAPTARRILERAGVADLFAAVVVSDEVGWRKPCPIIFETALARLEVAPAEALFVGDRADIDVLGAQRVGMAVAWLNPEAAPLPPDVAPPTLELRRLDDLRPALGLSARAPDGRA